MKFFIPLGFRYGNDSDLRSSLVNSVYGPYEDDKAVQEALARLWPNEKKEQFLVFDGLIVKVKPSTKEKPELRETTELQRRSSPHLGEKLNSSRAHHVFRPLMGSFFVKKHSK